MIKKIRRNIFAISLLGGLLISVLFGQFAAFAETSAEVRQDTLRLHILAAGDSAEDQRLKLLVRDALLREEGAVLTAAQNKEEALRLANAALPQFEATARRTLREAGCSAEVKAEIKNIYFETRRYDGVTLPAGRYDAVEITIGAGEGHNWWCVLFPTLCLPASSEEKALKAYNARERQLVAEDGYEVRFALLELAESALESMRGNG
ncbi:MAG: stage II sporulation protein R [Oscillospiraceae bacterium]|nr:stage II sporulation protein R [Oscillospiraceae bacterium]